MSVTVTGSSQKMKEQLEQVIAGLACLADETVDKVKRTNRTKMVEVDLSAAHTSHSLGLQSSVGETFHWLTIERCDDSLNYKLKQTNGATSDIFRAYESVHISHHDFTDIIVSNPASTEPNPVCRFIMGYYEG